MTRFSNANPGAVDIGKSYDGTTGEYLSTVKAVLHKTEFGGGFYSQSNPRASNGTYLDGGYFFSLKRTTSLSPTSAQTVFLSYSTKPVYKGVFVISPYIQGTPAMSLINKDTEVTNVYNQGARFWNKLRPDKPNFDFALNVLELRDLPNTLKASLRAVMDSVGKSRKKGSTLSKTGEYYLALNFGWLPLLGAIKDFVKAQSQAQAQLTQLIRDAGKPIRRRTRLNGEDTTSTIDGGVQHYGNGYQAGMYPSLSTYCYAEGRTWRHDVTTITTSTWAVGRFRYWLPPGPRDVVWKKKMLKRLYGAKVTPSTVYNLMPWSWLADYFTDVGDFVEAMSDGVGDRLVADYFYVMRTKTWNSTATGTLRTRGSSNPSLVNESTATGSMRQTLKIRTVGSPFGFGIKQSDLSPTQLAILGALGLSRLP